jgi:hypothetical protein
VSKRKKHGDAPRASARRGLGVAAVCAAGTLLPGAAEATSFAESTVGDFGDTFATRFMLPAGTDFVSGRSTPGEGIFANPDYFSFADLVPGSPFSMVLAVPNSDDFGVFQLFDGAGNALTTAESVWRPALTWTGVVPPSGEIAVRAVASQDFASYEVSIDTAHVPEPSTGVLAGLGAAALAVLRRRHDAR